MRHGSFIYLALSSFHHNALSVIHQMIDNISSWPIVAIAAFGVIAAIIAFLRTPRELRYLGISRAKSLEEKLKDLPESACAVIIKRDRKRALIESIPYVLIGIMLLSPLLALKLTNHPECVNIFGFNMMYIILMLVFYGIPIGFFVASLLLLKIGIKTIKTGYFLPLDTAVFNDTIAKKGRLSLLRGITSLVFPILTLFLVYIGNNAHTALMGYMSLQEISVKIEEKCPTIHNIPFN